MSKIMLDLETMSTSSNAALVAIGAVKFDNKEITDRFYITIDLQSSIRAGLEVDGGAVMFWLGQSQAARDELTCGVNVQLADALQQLAVWMGPVTELWGNGANFDEPILGNAYTKCNYIIPWKFWTSRCHRTMVQMFPTVPRPAFTGTEHNALDDAENQALHLIEILKTIGVR